MKNNHKKYPKISIIVPCYNEENTIGLLLKAIQKQDYPVSNIEIVIADSLSTDATKEKIAEFVDKNPSTVVKVVDNIKQTIPSGVNYAAEAARGEILIRLDAHSEPNKEYVTTSVDLLKNGVAENVGGIWEIQPGEDTCIAKAIAKAAAHPLGVGDAKYRISTQAQYVDTVPFGAFYKKTFEDVGGLDETLLANEDYEFNVRIKNSGGKVWLDPRIRSKYYARKNLKELAKQYWRYGFWKVKMLKRYPATIRWRQAIPPLFIASIFLIGILSIFNPLARIILGLEFGIYFLTLLFVSLQIAIQHQDLCFLLIPFAIITMHFSWGSGFIYSLFITKWKD
ncbi:MAG: glycosyltransferase family 2 protein [Anaerolineaceae bacterium]|nr:glycosyltransferase family 2 protein [Anaerolineaceae bacterium]